MKKTTDNILLLFTTSELNYRVLIWDLLSEVSQSNIYKYAALIAKLDVYWRRRHAFITRPFYAYYLG